MGKAGIDERYDCPDTWTKAVVPELAYGIAITSHKPTSSQGYRGPR